MTLTMKNKYHSPTIQVVEIDAQSLLQGVVSMEGTTGPSVGGIGGGVGLARERTSDWDDSDDNDNIFNW